MEDGARAEGTKRVARHVPDIETSKRLSAERQIHAAIDHFHRNEFECAMTLAAAAEGVRISGPVAQGTWLDAMGLRVRAAALARAAPRRTEEIEAARHRLSGRGQMGRLFRVLAFSAQGWARPAGF